MENQKPDEMHFTLDNGVQVNIRVHRPDITPEERERRLENIRKAAVRVILAAERMQHNGTT